MKVLFLIGLALITFGLINLYYAAQRSDWPVANGVIDVSSISAEKSITSIIPEVTYEYTVTGITYRENKAIFSREMLRSLLLHKSGGLNKYSVGQAVKVYYNPAVPKESVLDKGVQLGTWLLLSFGVACIALWMFLRRSPRNIFGLLRSSRNKETQKQTVSSLSISDQELNQETSDKPIHDEEFSLVGKWKVFKQEPSQVALMQKMMRLSGLLDAETSTNLNVGDTFFDITENKISFVNKGFGGFSSLPPTNYSSINNKLILAPIKTNAFTKKMEVYFPSFYEYSFEGRWLVLKTNPIVGFDNQPVVYFLKKAA